MIARHGSMMNHVLRLLFGLFFLLRIESFHWGRMNVGYRGNRMATKHSTLFAMKEDQTVSIINKLQESKEYTSLIQNIAQGNIEALEAAGYNVTRKSKEQIEDKEIELETIMNIIAEDSKEEKDPSTSEEGPVTPFDLKEIEEIEAEQANLFNANNFSDEEESLMSDIISEMRTSDLSSFLQQGKTIGGKGLDENFIKAMTGNKDLPVKQSIPKVDSNSQILPPKPKGFATPQNERISSEEKLSAVSSTLPTIDNPVDLQFKKLLEESMNEVLSLDQQKSTKELATDTYNLLEQLTSTNTNQNQASENTLKSLLGDKIYSIAGLLKVNLTEEILGDSEIQKSLKSVLELPNNMTIEELLPEEEELLRGSPLTAESIEANYQQQLKALEEEFREKEKKLQEEESELQKLLKEQEILRTDVLKISNHLSKQIKQTQEIISNIQERPDITTYLATLSFRPKDKVIAFIAGLGFSLKFVVDISTIFTKGAWSVLDQEDWLFLGVEGATVLLSFYFSGFLGAILRSIQSKESITSSTGTSKEDKLGGSDK